MAINKLWRFAARWVYGPDGTRQSHLNDRRHGQNCTAKLLAAVLTALALHGGIVPAHAQALAENMITQTEINAIADLAVRADAQWRFDQGKKWPTQADGAERSTDKDDNGRERMYFTPSKITAADCLPDRHWELVGGIAACVCNGDTLHQPVSNDQPSACITIPPVCIPTPKVPCSVCVPTFPTTCEGSDSVTRNSCTGAVTAIVPGGCISPPPVCSPVGGCEGTDMVVRDSCSGEIISVYADPSCGFKAGTVTTFYTWPCVDTVGQPAMCITQIDTTTNPDWTTSVSTRTYSSSTCDCGP